MLYIDPEECIDCDACVEACPVDACFAEDQVPDEWPKFVQINADYFKTRPEQALPDVVGPDLSGPLRRDQPVAALGRGRASLRQAGQPLLARDARRGLHAARAAPRRGRLPAVATASASRTSPRGRPAPRAS